MGIFDRFKKSDSHELVERIEPKVVKVVKVVQKQFVPRNFMAGVTDDLTWSFDGSTQPINELLRHQLRKMRNRSRDLCKNNDYGSKFIKLVKSNVVGVNGIRLQARSMIDDKKLDDADNKAIEAAWKDWGKPFNCSVDQKLSFLDIQNLVIGSIARDGEALVHIVDTPGDAHGIRLRVLGAEYLDENDNRFLVNGNRVVMGVEFTDAGLVVAYHIRKNKVKSWINIYPERDHVRILAADMIHLFITEEAEQVRGVPWGHSAIRRLRMAGKYEEAELVAAHFGAAKMGAVTSETGNDATVDDIADGDPEGEGELVEEIQAGMLHQLAAGSNLELFDPTHPTNAFPEFMRVILRGASAGFNVAYSGLSGDLENVNFSSIRSGVIDERDQWRMIQKWYDGVFHDRLYARWLPGSILHGRLALPMHKVDTKFQAIKWQARGWSAVDPKKDAETDEINLRVGLDTRQSILAEQGKDFEDVIDQLEYEQTYAQDRGVDIQQFAAIPPVTNTEADPDA